MKFRIRSVVLIPFLFFGMDFLPVISLEAFGPSGSFNHIRILKESFREFTEETGYEIRSDCQEMIVQGNLKSDDEFMNAESFHCDNNNVFGCGLELRDLKSKSEKAFFFSDSMKSIGHATHIIQDFYAHSNWVENHTETVEVAPLEEPWRLLSMPHIQTGYYDLTPIIHHEEEAAECLNLSFDQMKNFQPFATHICLNKDSEKTFRGGNPLSFSGNAPVLLHHWAGLHAVAHTKKFLVDAFRSHHKNLKLCLIPKKLSFSCNNALFDLRSE
ncbi:hypothetical protein CH379_013125 [Leptospira ellisii]|uniref:VWA7 N-terminal domain-containing protein n=2 Tax=Leptospira ellisii TaxID=2023197 RepID=A0AAE4TZT7_9LEPT|nr:hypothetical protein [Leptospira ellisii]MDV6236570.1 hypothetical protein [Leptospira ellisii]